MNRTVLLVNVPHDYSVVPSSQKVCYYLRLVPLIRLVEAVALIYVF
jgi:hypothetical protein